MTPELIIAILSAPVIAGLPTWWLKYRAQNHTRKDDNQTTILTRLENENVRVIEKNKEYARRITELERQEDVLRAALNSCHEACSLYRRRLIELGHEVS